MYVGILQQIKINFFKENFAQILFILFEKVNILHNG